MAIRTSARWVTPEDYKNYYGEEFGISVESNQGEYTCVKVRFPVLREEV